MKIVHELNQLDFGGVEKVIRSIIKHDQKNEHFVLVYKDGPFRPKLEEVGAKIVMVKDDEDVDMEADVIHVHSGGGFSELARSLGKDFPVIETIHSPVRSPMPDSLIIKRVGVCEAVSKRNSNCKTILNGIEFDELEPKVTREEIKATLGIPEGLPVIGRLGRIGTDKGLEDWLLACYYLQSKGYAFAPVIVGGEARNADGYMGKLKLMAASLPVKNVVWAGHRENIADWLQIMDVFMYPSPTEGFGLVFAEAMHMGCAVVTYKTEVTHELFAGYAKLTDQSRGAIGLAEAVGAVLDNPELMSELSGNAQGWVHAEYDAELMSQEYQELYDECCDADSVRKDQSQKTDVVFAR